MQIAVKTLEVAAVADDAMAVRRFFVKNRKPSYSGDRRI
jgi:hypothetical protein